MTVRSERVTKPAPTSSWAHPFNAGSPRPPLRPMGRRQPRPFLRKLRCVRAQWSRGGRRVLCAGVAVAAGVGLRMAVSVEQAMLEEEVNESEVLEILLPVTVFVLSDDEFLQVQEQAMLVPELMEEKQEVVGSCCLSEGGLRPLCDSEGLDVWEEHSGTANQNGSTQYTEEEWIPESMCNNSKLTISNGISKDEQSHSAAVPTSPCQTELAKMSKVSGRKECNDNDAIPKIPLLCAADSEDRDKTTDHLVLPAVCGDEELSCVPGVLNDESQEKQPQVHEEMGTALEVEDADSLQNGNNDTNGKTNKGSKSEDETPGSVLQHDFKEGPELDSDRFIHRGSTSELQKDGGKPESNASISAVSATPEEHIYKSLTPFSKKRCRRRRIISSRESETKGQQEDLAWLSNSMNIKPLPKASCSTNKRGKIHFNCKFCSSVYKSSALLKRHVYLAHKKKRKHKCSFCKKTFFFAVNLKKHLKLHKTAKLQKERKNRMSARKVRQRTEERKSERKKRESKYEKYFMKMERDFTSLGVPVIFSCKTCYFDSSNPKTFIHHMRAHKERPPYWCPQCDYSSSSLSYLLNHMYWHAGYKLYKCRFCTFFSLYFSSMVKHSYMHAGPKPYSCEYCQSTFTSINGLKRHRRLHVSEETCKVDFGNGRKRTRRSSKSYACDECNVLFYSRGHLNSHKKCHKQHKVSANGYMNQSSEYRKSKRCKIESDSKGCVPVPLSDEDDDLAGGVCKTLVPEIDFVRAGDVQGSKKRCPRRAFTKNSHVRNIAPIFGGRSEVLDLYKMDTVVYKEDPETSHSQIQDTKNSGSYYKPEGMWPSSLSMFKLYKCKHCDYATTVHSSYKQHLKVHTKKGPFVCQECNKTYKTSNRLQRHRQLHVKDEYEVSHYFYADSHLDNHGFHHEMQVGTYPERDFGSSQGFSGVCSMLASETYGEQADTKRDIDDLLSQSQPRFYQCVECEYSTYVLSSLRLHIRTHTGEKPYSCSVCQKEFRTSSHLKRHQVLHCNTEHFKCRKCDYSTNKWLSLKQHLASHAVNESSSADYIYEQNTLPVKTYTCEECGYTTFHSGNFKQHRRIHTGEKPFKCGQCGVAFRTSGHLKRHLLTHVKFHCSKCDFSAVDKCVFQKHVKTHRKNKKQKRTQQV
uniref:Zinc finger protein 845-like n=2 Tax=Coturnix japonica TaxID=93934 RepID=A0A8C2SS30_COTJA